MIGVFLRTILGYGLSIFFIYSYMLMSGQNYQDYIDYMALAIVCLPILLMGISFNLEDLFKALNTCLAKVSSLSKLEQALHVFFSFNFYYLGIIILTISWALAMLMIKYGSAAIMGIALAYIYMVPLYGVIVLTLLNLPLIVAVNKQFIHHQQGKKIFEHQRQMFSVLLGIMVIVIFSSLSSLSIVLYATSPIPAGQTNGDVELLPEGANDEDSDFPVDEPFAPETLPEDDIFSDTDFEEEGNP